ncbi:MAG: branched-chain amino acid ABC transporter permease [Deltaproteobacteria bacterium]|jgi:branched-chain amino acid transport system permease protein|nr:branched-chain amino acid ABC transporter permease [Deltaproteobacteria bacterium]
MIFRAKNMYPLMVLALLLLLPLGSPVLYSDYYLDLFTKVLIFGIMLLGYDILAGYTGLVSLGHALFFGLGGYTAAYTINHLTSNLFPVLVIALLATVVVGLFVGFFSTQTKDIFFVFLTLAFAQLFYLVAFNLTTVTGGDNGISIAKATIGIPGVWEAEIARPFGFYYLVLFFFVLVYLICRRVINSPFGKVLVAIRENEERVSYLGYNIRKLKIKSYMISACMATVAGVLFGTYQDFVSPGMLSWTLSGDLILMSVLGGIGTLVGPVLGGAIIILLGDELSSITENWMIFIGGFFVLTIIFAPGGVMGLLSKIRWRNKQ